jgi:WhiB family transcriptional regulator, redox-sensing transcriptional regulator
MIDESWRAEAACKEVDTAVFFPDNQHTVPDLICEGCPVREVCLEYALANNIEHGVWGGLGENERRRLRRRRRDQARVA